MISFKITFHRHREDHSPVVRQWDEVSWECILHVAQVHARNCGLKLISIELLEGK